MPRRNARAWFWSVSLLLALLAVILRGPVRTALTRWQPDSDAAASLVTATITNVVDGDTVEIDTGQSVRILGIDAPEAGTPFADEARATLSAMLLSQKVHLAYDIERTDRYGRQLAHVLLRDGTKPPRIAGERLLRQGLASLYMVPPNLLFSERFALAQRDAVAARRGIWSLPVTEESYYITSSHRFHRPSCRHVQSIPRPRRVATRIDALRNGKGPCRSCRP